MNEQQKRTVRGLALLGLGGFALLVGALVLEIVAVKSGGNSTISEALWSLWASQPWVILIASHALLGPAWYLAGHFTAQSAVVYEAIRRGINLDAALLLASESLASYRLAKETGNGREPMTVMVSPEFVRMLVDSGALAEHNVTSGLTPPSTTR